MLSTAASLALLSLSLSLSLCPYSVSLRRKRRALHIFPSRFSSSNTGLQGAKSFARDRNGLRISACASPICAEVLAGEILKALGGIKEISLRNASAHPRGFTPSFIFTPRRSSAEGTRVIYAEPLGKLFISELTRDFLRASVMSRRYLLDAEDEGKHSTDKDGYSLYKLIN